jgi:hypothetical protein
VRLTIDHPYHSLYHIYALANGNRDALGRRIQGHVSSDCTQYAYACIQARTAYYCAGLTVGKRADTLAAVKSQQQMRRSLGVLQGESSGGMERTIDQDKVAAAQEILNATRASKLRYALHHMTSCIADQVAPVDNAHE